MARITKPNAPLITLPGTEIYVHHIRNMILTKLCIFCFTRRGGGHFRTGFSDIFSFLYREYPLGVTLLIPNIHLELVFFRNELLKNWSVGNTVAVWFKMLNKKILL